MAKRDGDAGNGGTLRRAADPRAERSRAAALRAASELLIENGWSGVTHVHVAARSGVGRTTLYRHWPDAALLVRELLAHLFQVEHFEQTGDLREDLVGELSALLDRLHEPETERALRVIIDKSPHDPLVMEVLVARGREVTHGLCQIVDDARARGELPEALETFRAVDQLLGPLIYRRLISGRPFAERYVRDLVDGFLRAHACPDVSRPTVSG
ncbi:TetR/AcrR family transcriptional regulator C-terminal ligand-binding domain-containing protein [Streptomyces sp. B1866]|uniref:TetR-like C-terminal domain-containing protein n=1 Tax=Streptomyces sp. B1866 TaxID=3075431 RepID=UPI00288EE966|nr:TetR/AcrR family transcriptional regulator C-terminal ligand-binding domain-containing protein [Streptomyces sp. B1866]MDT3397049.1 TetR/AcrR family transcriptional regulator C-terminal ligand-binding domain-containing protein [Streptomyces sp. B1866]